MKKYFFFNLKNVKNVKKIDAKFLRHSIFEIECIFQYVYDISGEGSGVEI